jgi:hypothetical protein
VSTLAKFLQAKEPLFDHALKQLEERTGKTGIDAALTAEIAQKAAERTKLLGLGPDCTGRELYAALDAQIKAHDDHLAQAIGGHQADNVREMIPLIVKAALAAPMPKSAYVLRHEVAADMLAAMPPETVMERLGYDSVHQLLAHEDIYELYLALRFVQDSEWLNKFDAQYHKLTPEDFTQRDIRVVVFDSQKWGNIAEHFVQKKRHNITHSKEMGAVAVVPITQLFMRGITLKDLPLMLHYFNEIRLYSAFFKLMRTKRNFGEIVASTLIADTPNITILKGQYVHWRVIQRYFAKLKEPHPEIFEPHVQPEDLHWRRAEEVLYEIDPEMAFWRDLDYVAAMKGEDPVTFNLMDVSFSYSNETEYAERSLYHFRESLWNEVFARYMGEQTLKEEILVRLDNDVIAPEELPLP